MNPDHEFQLGALSKLSGRQTTFSTGALKFQFGVLFNECIWVFFRLSSHYVSFHSHFCFVEAFYSTSFFNLALKSPQLNIKQNFTFIISPFPPPASAFLQLSVSQRSLCIPCS